jgi:hypothetical protein
VARKPFIVLARPRSRARMHAPGKGDSSILLSQSCRATAQACHYNTIHRVLACSAPNWANRLYMTIRRFKAR